MMNNLKGYSKQFINKIVIVLILSTSLQAHSQSKSIESQALNYGNFKFSEQNITQIQEGYKNGSFSIKEMN